MDESSRAARFEDEKSRIIDSCFLKKEQDGAYAESYITHIPVIEDASCPSSPPPPQSSANNKKPRVIIVAVRRSGRVRLHKARENTNKTFSIGKTWQLDHLTAIESFTGILPQSQDEQQKKVWAGPTGMLITVQKPYFWQAASQKEKDFFIGSLVKIFRKYTGGKEPILTGFTPYELSSFSVSAAGRPKTPQSNMSNRVASSMPSPAIRQPPGPPSDVGLTPPMPSSSTVAAQRDRYETDSQASFQPPSSTVAPQRDRYETDSPASFQQSSSTAAAQRDRYETDSPASFQPSSSTTAAQRDRYEIDSKANFQPSAEEPPQAPMRSPDRPTRDRSDRSPIRIPMRSPTRAKGLAAMTPSKPIVNLKELEAAERKRKNIEATPKPSDIPQQSIEAPEKPSVDITSPPDTPGDSPATEAHRPGLGPMIKKKSGKDIAGRFRQAAAAASAFKPRAGGAGDKFLNASNKEPETDDGIHGVYSSRRERDPAWGTPPPEAPQTTYDRWGNARAPESDIHGRPLNEPHYMNAKYFPDKPVNTAPKHAIPASQTDSPPETGPDTENTVDALGRPTDEGTPSRAERKPASPEERKKRIKSRHVEYANIIGIDPALLEGRTDFIDEVLDRNGWSDEQEEYVSYQTLKDNINRELNMFKYGIYGSLGVGDERVAQVHKLIDEAMDNAVQLDSLLSLYAAELSTVAEDVEYIEAQEQGLQVYTANQKALLKELRYLRSAIEVPADHLSALWNVTFSGPSGVEAIEVSLLQVYKGLLSVDPAIRIHSRPSASTLTAAGILVGYEDSNMRIIRERKKKYYNCINTFLDRFQPHWTDKLKKMSWTMEKELTDWKQDLHRTATTKSDGKMNMHLHVDARSVLFIYSAFFIYIRDLSRQKWDEYIQSYERTMKKYYNTEIRDVFTEWKKDAKKSAADLESVLFTHADKDSKESEGNMVTRRITVKRSRNHARDTGKQQYSLETTMQAHEAFASALFETTSALITEQNFIGDLFHISSNTVNFPEAIAESKPVNRSGRDQAELTKLKNYETDRNMAKYLEIVMKSICESWPEELQNFIDGAVTQDPFQAVGILAALEMRIADLEHSNQEFIIHTLQEIHDRLSKRFDRFVEEQIRAIEETKVKIKKHKGLMPFMHKFPLFVDSVEQMLPSKALSLDIREKVNQAYENINRSMFESLKFMAKEAPAALAGQKPHIHGAADSEDKEALNFHIVHIQNLNHYVEELHTHGVPELEEWKDSAEKELAEHLADYINSVIRRPLGKLLDPVEAVETMRGVMHPQVPATDIALKPSHSAAVFKKVLSDFDAKDVRSKIEALKKRVEKHFGEADDPSLSKNLVARVLKDCEDRYFDVLIRTNRIVRDVYEGNLEVDFKRDDISRAFKRSPRTFSEKLRGGFGKQAGLRRCCSTRSLRSFKNGVRDIWTIVNW